MELDPDDVFRDDDDDSEYEYLQQKEATKELVVYVVDASPRMFDTMCPGEDGKEESHFHIAVSCISQALKTQIINRSYDEVAICFFNTREKKNLQDLNGVFVFNVTEREYLDRPTARLIKEFDHVEESFQKQIGSQYGIVPGSRDNSLYNALWAAQALLRKGSAKTTEKRILLFTNEDDPFGSIKGVTKLDMARTTLQRAKDAQDLGITIELLPLSSPDAKFRLSHFYADMIGLEGEALSQFEQSVSGRLEDMRDMLRKKMFKKRRYRRITFSIADGLSIELSAYAVIRPTLPGMQFCRVSLFFAMHLPSEEEFSHCSLLNFMSGFCFQGILLGLTLSPTFLLSLKDPLYVATLERCWMSLQSCFNPIETRTFKCWQMKYWK
ncbi:hypothetical protein Droror1_Dr00025990 [Drosera rotundifolia]